MKYTSSLCLAIALLGVACSSGSKPQDPQPAVAGVKPDGQGRSKLWLSAVPGTDSVVLKVHYEKGDAAAPRVADMRIVHSENLVLAGSTPGASAVAAGKELTTQEPQAGLVRVILLSRDTRELGTGELAELQFKKTDGGSVKVDLLMDKPVFAPAEAMQGLMIGDPLRM